MSERPPFAALLDAFVGRRAVVAGDLMLDEYIFGSATRISPEAPVMVIRHRETRRVPGGAANVARNLAALGARVAAIGVVGEDEAGQALRSALSSEPGIEADVAIGPIQTTRKTRVVAEHAHQVIRIDSEDDGPLPAAVESELQTRLARRLEECDVVVLSDYRKGALGEATVRFAIEAARKRGLPLVANPKPRSLALYRGATWISLNRSEAAAASGVDRAFSDEEAPEVAERLAHELNAGVIVTLGESGMAAHGPRGGMRVPAPAVEVADVAGAGDTVIAAVALASCSGGLDESSLALSARLAAAVVSHVGVAVPSRADLDRIRQGS